MFSDIILRRPREGHMEASDAMGAVPVRPVCSCDWQKRQERLQREEALPHLDYRGLASKAAAGESV